MTQKELTLLDLYPHSGLIQGAFEARQGQPGAQGS